LDVHRDLATEVTLDAIVAIDHFTEPVSFLVRQVADPGIRVHASLLEDLLARVKAGAIDIGQPDFHARVAGPVDTWGPRPACLSTICEPISNPAGAGAPDRLYHYPWRCLCRGFVQITRTMPLRRMMRQRSRRFETDADTFMS